MQVDCIDNIHQFNKLKATWDAVYSADPHVTVFVSWPWLRGWIEGTTDPWRVLCIRPDKVSPYVGFLPVSLRTTRKERFLSCRELHMGGNPSSDHTGFVCLPSHEEKAIYALASYIQRRMKWERFRMADVFDPRLDLFLKYFSPKKFNIRESDATPCPYITLPETWDQYLQEFLGRKTRRNIRRPLKNVEKLTDFHITDLQSTNLESQVETLLSLWKLRWKPQSNHTFHKFRHLFRHCFEANCLWLHVFWDGQTPIAALAAFIDRHKKTFSAYMTGYNSSFAKLSPGTAMFGYSIRYAIQNGYEQCDFLRGGENYKISAFGAKERFNRNIIIRRRSTINRLTTMLKSYRTICPVSKSIVIR